MSFERFSRREFLKLTSISGVTVAFLNPLRALSQTNITPYAESALDWRDARGGARFRIDGVAKVTGAKVFARDIRAKNMTGWPSKQGHALVVRAAFADREVLGLDMSILGQDLGPDKLITAEELAQDKLVLPKFYGTDLTNPDLAHNNYQKMLYSLELSSLVDNSSILSESLIV